MSRDGKALRVGLEALVLETPLTAVYRAIESGDHDAFMKALASGGEPGIVSWLVAREVPNGFFWLCDDRLSLAQLCFQHNRPEMLRAAAAAAWVDGDVDGKLTPADRMSTLCTRYSYGAQARINLAHHAAFSKMPQSVEFIVLALEHGQDDSHSLDSLSESDPEAGALVTEARMRMAIETPRSAAPSSQSLEASGTPTPGPGCKKRRRQVL